MPEQNGDYKDGQKENNCNRANERKNNERRFEKCSCICEEK